MPGSPQHLEPPERSSLPVRFHMLPRVLSYVLLILTNEDFLCFRLPREIHCQLLTHTLQSSGGVVTHTNIAQMNFKAWTHYLKKSVNRNQWIFNLVLEDFKTLHDCVWVSVVKCVCRHWLISLISAHGAISESCVKLKLWKSRFIIIFCLILTNLPSFCAPHYTVMSFSPQ